MEDCITFTIRKASRALTRYFNKQLLIKGCHLPITQIQMLWIIRKYPNQNVTFLSKILAMDRTTSTRNASLLIKNNYIICPTDEGDKRNRLLVLTKDGEKVLDEGILLLKEATKNLSSTLKKIGIDSDYIYRCLYDISENFYEKVLKIDEEAMAKKKRARVLPATILTSLSPCQ